MALTSASKRRRVEEGMQGKIQPKKKIRKQKYYHSDSEDEDETQRITQKPAKTTKKKLQAKPQKRRAAEAQKESDDESITTDDEQISERKASLLESDSENDEDVDEAEDDEPVLDGDSESEDDEDDEDGLPKKQRKLPKRHDPTAFSTSISKILSTKIPTSNRADPLLSRSRTAVEVTSSLVNEKLEARARAKLRAQKKEELERGHVTDVLGIDRGEAGETVEIEKKLRKIAQRGVIKLFNAVRAAQVRGEELAKEERRKRVTVGMDERKKAVNEVSKQGFLELINGKGNKKISIEEA